MNTDSTTKPQASSPAATLKQAPSTTTLSFLVALALRTGTRISILPNPSGVIRLAAEDVWRQRLDQLLLSWVSTLAKATGHRAVIGSLDQIEAMLRGEAGTQVRADGAATL